MRRSVTLLVAALSAPLLAVSMATVAPPPAAAAVGDDTVLAFGSAAHFGSPTGQSLASQPVALTPTPTGSGYWIVGGDGGIFAYGDAPFLGSTGAITLNKPIVGMAATPSGQGYWMVASDGGIFAYGDAPFLGSTGAISLNKPVVGMAATPSGKGYWLVASDGGIFAYGDAPFLGSTGAVSLTRPIVGLARTPSGGGYWMAGADGGVFAFGDAPFLGAATNSARTPVTSIAGDPGSSGYRMVSENGGVFSFGAPFAGSADGAVAAGRRAVAIASTKDGGYWVLMARRPPEQALGAFGPGVRAMQQRLFDLGYWGPVDGVFSSMTLQQVYAFQKASRLPRDGRLDDNEMRLLETATRITPRFQFGRGIEIDKTRQIIITSVDGRTEWVFATSTGNGARYGRGSVAITPEGRFRIERAINGLRIAPLGVLWRPRYFVGGYAIHGSPSIPPFPASHGCARLHNSAINFVWDANLMPIGAPVWVYS